jgi:hypothetical protein
MPSTTEDTIMKTTARRLTIFALTLTAAAALAQRPQAPANGPEFWRNIGPDRGGRSLTSAGSSSRPNEYYLYMPSRPPIPTSSISAWAKPSSAAT